MKRGMDFVLKARCPWLLALYLLGGVTGPFNDLMKPIDPPRKMKSEHTSYAKFQETPGSSGDRVDPGGRASNMRHQ